MASITRESNGRRMIQFVAANGKRKTLRLGKMPQRQAEAIKLKVENLISSTLSGHAMDDETARWLSKLDSVMIQKLARVGLVQAKESETLAKFLDRYILTRTDLKPRSLDIVRRTRDSLVDFFGTDKSLKEITPGDAKEWRRYLTREGGRKGQPLAKNTVNDRCKKAKQFFKAAVEHRLISENPFLVLKKTNVRANPDRFRYIDAETTRLVIHAAGNPEFELVIALCRFGGLRNPSETLALKWEDIDLTAGRMVVTSPKTEHHEGKESREVPIFPELRPFLKTAWDLNPYQTGYVINQWRSQDKNFRPRMHRAIRRAGLSPWPKPFQNLRSSCQTDLEENFPSHVVCAWMGNSEQVAREHYLQVTDEHFSRAIGLSEGTEEEKPSDKQTELNDDQKGMIIEALQNALQQVAESTRTESQLENAIRIKPKQCLEMRHNASSCENVKYTRRDSNPQPPVPKTEVPFLTLS
jgi:integrase